MGQVVLTNHVKQRAIERGVDLNDLDKTVRFPDQVVNSKTFSSKKHSKNFGAYQITAALKHKDNNWIIVSAWRNSGSSPVQKQFFLEKIINSFLLKVEKFFSRRSNR